jgi:DNA-binding MarR family transcriptional regulator
VGESDARGRVVALTGAGRALVDEAFEAHMANEHRLVGLLPARDRELLAGLLERWGRALGAD